MPDEKDRFGDKLRDIEKAHEDTYFAERDRVLLQKLKAQTSGQQEDTLKELARNRCPKCGEALKTKRQLGITLAECPACKGIWLEKGEVEQIAVRESNGWLARYLGLGD